MHFFCFKFQTATCKIWPMSNSHCPHTAATPNYPLPSPCCFLCPELPYFPFSATLSTMSTGKQAFPGLI